MVGYLFVAHIKLQSDQARIILENLSDRATGPYIVLSKVRPIIWKSQSLLFGEPVTRHRPLNTQI